MTVTPLICDPSGPQWSTTTTSITRCPHCCWILPTASPFTPWHHSWHPGGVLSIILSININSRYGPQCPRSFGAGVLFAFYQPHPAASKESINCQQWRWQGEGEAGAQCRADSRPAARTAAPRLRYRQPLTSPAPPPESATRIGRRRWLRAASCRHRGRHLSPPAH